MILFFLVGTIKGSKVDVGGCIVDGDIVVIGPEDAGKGEELDGSKLDQTTEVKR